MNSKGTDSDCINVQPNLSLVVRKPVFGVSDQVRHKPGCTITEYGKRFEISDLVEEVLYYPGRENKGADQLRGYRVADLRLCFRICKKPVFSRHGSFAPFLFPMWHNQASLTVWLIHIQ